MSFVGSTAAYPLKASPVAADRLPLVDSATGALNQVQLSVLLAAWAAQNANKVFAGPTSGGDAVPTFRALVPADYPTLVGDSGAGGTKGAVPAPAAGDAAAGRFLKADGTWTAPAGTGDVTGPASSVDSEVALFSGTTGKTLKRATGTGIARLASGVQSAAELSGDVTTSGSNATTIANDAVSNAKLANMANATLKGRTTAGTGDPEDLTAAQAAAIVQGDGLTVDLAGFRGVPQGSHSANYTTVAADAGKHLLHPSGDANARTFTIDSNANVAYPVGTAITFINETSQVLSIAITSDTLTLANSTTTGTRSLAQNGVATAIKVTSTKWIISGAGLT